MDVVINCVGILRQRFGESYEAIHHLMPAALAQACAQSSVRLIHTSALGLHEGAKSRFLSSKLRGAESGHAKLALQLGLPNWISRIGSHLCDLFRFSPFSYGATTCLSPTPCPLCLAGSPCQ
jgi:hypothetical protein